MRTLFEQLNINNDVFKQATVVLFFCSQWSKQPTKHHLRSGFDDIRINIANRLLDVPQCPHTDRCLASLLSEPVLHQRV